jgi:predicted phosphodiesterase
VKLALISEVHANSEALQATLDDIALRSVDRIVCLGDIVGYNTHPHECIALLRDAQALCVAGNHDRAVCGQITTETFSYTAARAVAWTRARLTSGDFAFLAGLPLKATIDAEVVAVHGALHPDIGCEIVRLDNDESRALSFAALIAHPSGARICAFGHTHDLAIYEFRDGRTVLRAEDEVRLRDDAYYLINPGTVGAPRGTDRRTTYMILDLARRTVAVYRVAYDASVPLAATRKAGLAPRLWFLPAPMRAVISRSLHVLRGVLASAKRQTNALWPDLFRQAISPFRRR